MQQDDAHNLLLRAELSARGGKVIAQARELTEKTVFLVTDEALTVGEDVRVHLSFPRLMEPVDIQARVVGQRAPTHQPGELAGVELEFVAVSEDGRDRLRALIERDPAAAPAATSSEYRVLLVEDNSFIHDMFSYGIGKYFKEKNVTLSVEHAGDADAAWRKMLDVAYDLIIVDYFLPREDGAELIARMRGVPGLRETPVVAISVGGAAARDATISAGADLFLDKPVVLRDLFATLERLARPQGGSQP